MILHEYGHFYEDKLGKLPWIPSQHDGCRATISDPMGIWTFVVNSPEHAWMESFATAFALAATNAQPAAGFSPTLSSMETHTPCPDPPAGTGGAAVESHVTDARNDLIDTGANEPQDRLADLGPLLLQTVDRERDTPNAPNVFGFREAALARGVPRADLDAILVLNGIAPPAPMITLEEAPPAPAPSTKVCTIKSWTPDC